MGKRCLILVCGTVKKNDKFVSDICDTLNAIGDVPSLQIDADDIKSADFNIPEMLAESDALLIVYKNDDNDDGAKDTYTKDNIWDIVNAAELSGLQLAYLYPDKEYKSLSRYLMEALDHENEM